MVQAPSVDPIEKHHSPLRRPDLISIENLAMENRQLLEANNDGEEYLCVNPYEVNPLSENTASLLPDDECITQQQKSEIKAIQENCSVTSCRGFYGSIKLEMEEFGDISSYLLPRPTSTNSVDELTTPTFEFEDGFDFGLGNYDTRVQSHPTVKVERGDAFHRNSHEKNKDIFYGTEVPRNDNIASEIGNMVNLGSAEVYSPASDNGTYIFEESRVAHSVNDSALSVNSFPPSRGGAGGGFFVEGPETPDDSNSSVFSREKKKLVLDTSRKVPIEQPISTPNIIAEVVDLETGGFNILDLVEEDSFSLVTGDDIFQTLSVHPAPARTASAQFLSKLSAHALPAKHPRKKRRRVVDDDEYLPPTKKTSSRRQSVGVPMEESDSESGSESEYNNSNNCRSVRGRRAKRTDSIASDSSNKEGDVSKYRELRDKNNEASKKSRQKRKIKELELEKEADELRSRNIKLKAQVEELEKMVNNFRDNLFKIMMIKK